MPGAHRKARKPSEARSEAITKLRQCEESVSGLRQL